MILGGFLGLLPAGGVVWDYIQYPLGFAKLGCDVYYVEDTGLWSTFHDGHCETPAEGAHRAASYLSSCMQAFGLEDRWAYQDAASGCTLGLPENAVKELVRSADVFVNISCSTVMRDESYRVPVRILIDTDPMFTQIQCATDVLFTPGRRSMRDLLAAHTHHFTFGENIGASDCRIPDCGFTWHPTRQPVCLDHWPAMSPANPQEAHFTTVMNWRAGKPLEYEGETWGQKDVEFQRVMALPRTVPGAKLALAVNETGPSTSPADGLRRYGWTVLDPRTCVHDWETYRSFIQQSRGEFSVAKETYVKARTGWFSCRSACYLASGRPVIAQDTGWSRYLPSGSGLLAFSTVEEATEALQQVQSDPDQHGASARKIAEEHFDSSLVLGKMLADAGA